MDGLDASGRPLGAVGKAGETPSYGTVANNSGGSMPASSGSANLGGGARAEAKGNTLKGYNVEGLDQGFRSGGGYTFGSGSGQGREGNSVAGSNGRFQNGNGRRLAGDLDPSGLKGLDVKKHLPGGQLDPNRHVIGYSGRRPDIHGPNADLLNKIRDKMFYRCQMGYLCSCDK